ncbi:MAG: GNAT family N-acetyltransferase [Dehalococcoidia bacterium]
MANEAFRLRDGTTDDLPALAALDSSFGNEWVLVVGRGGDAIEQTIELRWRKVKPEGSTRSFGTDETWPADEALRADRFVVAEVDGRVAGFVALREQWNRTVEIDAIVVEARYRGRGIGRWFVEDAEAFARERGLRAVQWEAQTDNRNAIEFAVARGFRIAGFHDAFYRNDDRERQTEPDFLGIAVFMTKAVLPTAD